ncbi:hypothetical protein DUNSADRAFT_13506 [Dunaliella salina]|uniref:Encoded protein n=1 Tax=Dunaliella salina TaxID=3046 RepID=A0ABQ7FRD4_DUNSA|nr:hypothetical protein DUNSADRAFT_13506 [Dunaliella salina]|eukprot:KAF5825217.1 hypothetical protein DUNSADRAFT_13506 [Dunaliella salina]
MAHLSLLPWHTANCRHGPSITAAMAHLSLLPWPTAYASQGPFLIAAMAHLSLPPWPFDHGCHGPPLTVLRQTSHCRHSPPLNTVAACLVPRIHEGACTSMAVPYCKSWRRSMELEAQHGRDGEPGIAVLPTIRINHVQYRGTLEHTSELEAEL